MPKPSSSLADDFSAKLNQIETTRLRLEALYGNGQLSERAILQLYEGLFLKAHIGFEAFLENLFIGLLLTGHGVESTRRDIVPRVVIRSHKVVWNVLLGQTSLYINWLPYKSTLDLAQRYFREGRPFSDLEQPEKDLISRAYKIRNAIGHGSKYSLKKFQEGLLGAGVPVKERNPAGFLRGIFRVNPVQRRFEVYTSELLRIARILST